LSVPQIKQTRLRIDILKNNLLGRFTVGVYSAVSQRRHLPGQLRDAHSARNVVTETKISMDGRNPPQGISSD